LPRRAVFGLGGWCRACRSGGSRALRFAPGQLPLRRRTRCRGGLGLVCSPRAGVGAYVCRGGGGDRKSLGNGRNTSKFAGTQCACRAHGLLYSASNTPQAPEPMDLTLTDEQRMTQQLGRDFAYAKSSRGLASWTAPVAGRRAGCALGRARVDGRGRAGRARRGGARHGLVRARDEEISRPVVGGVIMSVNNSLVCDPLMKFGDEWQKRNFCSPRPRGSSGLSSGSPSRRAAPTRRRWRRSQNGMAITT